METQNAKPLIDALLLIMCDAEIQRKLGLMTKQINPIIAKAIRDYQGQV